MTRRRKAGRNVRHGLEQGEEMPFASRYLVVLCELVHRLFLLSVPRCKLRFCKSCRSSSGTDPRRRPSDGLRQQQQLQSFFFFFPATYSEGRGWPRERERELQGRGKGTGIKFFGPSNFFFFTVSSLLLGQAASSSSGLCLASAPAPLCRDFW